jgi:hypothetical protein
MKKIKKYNYIADDGTNFSSSKDCKKYEKQKIEEKAKIEKSVEVYNNIKKIQLDNGIDDSIDLIHIGLSRIRNIYYFKNEKEAEFLGIYFNDKKHRMPITNPPTYEFKPGWYIEQFFEGSSNGYVSPSYDYVSLDKIKKDLDTLLEIIKENK